MRATSLLRKLIDQEHTKVCGFEVTDEGLLLDVAPTTRHPRCGGCGRRCTKVYDSRERTWRHQDFAGMRVVFRYRIRRTECPGCGVTTELVPWAEPGSWFTRDFEQTVALLAQQANKTFVSMIMGIAWSTVGSIVTRVVARHSPENQLDGLRRIGIDERSYKKHHRYVTVVVDHDTGRVVWAGEGRKAENLYGFFDSLGDERIAALELISIDMGEPYQKAIRERAPRATIVFDRFHVQRLAHDALDEVRRALVRELKGTEDARHVKRMRWVTQKNPGNLTDGEQQKLAALQKTNSKLYRAYLLKETLCDALESTNPIEGRRELVSWCSWAARSRLPSFRKVAKTIKRHLDGIVAYIETGLSNGRSEGVNNKLNAIIHRSFGLQSAGAVIAYIRLCCGGIRLTPVTHPRPTVREST